MRFSLILVAALRLAVGAEQDEREVLARVTAKVLESNRRVPNYTCVETITRQFFAPIATQLPHACPAILEIRRHPTPDFILRRVMTDRLRLDVAMTARGEVFSWAGASRFDDNFVDRIAHKGPMASGLFGALLICIFETDVKAFTFTGKKTVNDRTLFEYSFQVAQPDSHYKVRIPDGWAFTAYGGTIRVDPKTASLVEIEMQANQLPEGAGECMSSFHFELKPATIGEGEFLLPARAHQVFIAATGNEFDNDTQFANCREYRGESVAIFDGEPVPDRIARPAPALRIPSFPNGSRFAFVLSAPISSDTAAAGDPFHGQLIEPLRAPDLKHLAPDGAKVAGHLLRVEIHHIPPAFVVVLKPEWIEIKGSKVPIIAVPDWTRVTAMNAGKDRKRLAFNVPDPGEERAGQFRFPTEHSVVPKGFQSYWRIAPPYEDRKPIGH
ncbi:MAG TPA: hypothetical protein VKU19_02870 [Bryobacteraceae bacterium]|nr:hypothetical protein [Bryobacteraceae bacterium]